MTSNFFLHSCHVLKKICKAKSVFYAFGRRLRCKKQNRHRRWRSQNNNICSSSLFWRIINNTLDLKPWFHRRRPTLALWNQKFAQKQIPPKPHNGSKTITCQSDFLLAAEASVLLFLATFFMTIVVWIGDVGWGRGCDAGIVISYETGWGTSNGHAFHLWLIPLQKN